jgi:hypothetical protein
MGVGFSPQLRRLLYLQGMELDRGFNAINAIGRYCRFRTA